ncbi:MAG: succinyl-diaminopimelate desuccinylase [Gammaproteobacteria bacterium]|nr:succinyl-diaminopimelate desuccinylase [Gammaproteobacteria bacterium]
MTSPTLELTCDLITRESVTPADAGCLGLIEARLVDRGFAATRLPSGEVDNLWAIRGNGGPVFAFAGHTDVVPPGSLESWHTPPFEPVVKDGLLYGRGAADMKGSLAAMVVAAERFLDAHSNHRGSIAFVLTSDEEGPAVDGTTKVVEYLKQNAIEIQWCVVGEPSSVERLGDTVRVGRRGSLNARLLVRGEQGHVAYPERASNPIHNSLGALAELKSHVWDRGNEYYPPTSFQISNINAGTGIENVIPQDLEVLFNFRYSTENSAATLQQTVIEILDRFALDYELNWHLSGEPFLTPGGELVETASRVIRDLLGVTPELSTGGGTSDGRFIVPMGVQLIEIGPVNATIHKINECVAVDDLDRLTDVYAAILERMLA